MSANHTPLPWTFETGLPDGGFLIQGADQSVLCARAPWPSRRDESVANGAFIVTAVNSHQGLVEALKEARLYVVQAIDDDGGYDNCDISDRFALDRVDAALSSLNASEGGK